MNEYNLFPYYYDLKDDASIYNDGDIMDNDKLLLEDENEWTQEYQLIYKSYTLEYYLEYKEQ